MEKRTLGKTGLQVTVLGYGSMALRGPSLKSPEGATDDDADHILNGVLDAGINFIDTAPDYGLAEERIGKFIAHRRHEYYLATKCGCNIPATDDPNAPRHIWTRDRLLENIELSLRRMKTDYVDIWQLHNPDVESVPSAELIKVMEQVKRQGKARHISISSKLPEVRTFIQQEWFDTYQIPYSVLDRKHEVMIAAAAKSGAGTIIRGGIAKGEPATDLSGDTRWSRWIKANLDELLGEGESRSSLVLRFTITNPHVHTTIVDTQNPQHLADNLKSVGAGPLDQDVFEQAKRQLDAIGQTPEAMG